MTLASDYEGCGGISEPAQTYEACDALTDFATASPPFGARWAWVPMLAALLVSGVYWILHSNPVAANLSPSPSDATGPAGPSAALTRPAVPDRHAPGAGAVAHEDLAPKRPNGSREGMTLATPPPAWQTYEVGSGDTLSELFKRAGFSATELQEVMALGGGTDSLRTLHPGDEVRLLACPDGTLAGLRYAIDPLTILVVTRNGSGFASHVDHVTPTRRTFVVSGAVHGPLTVAMHNAGLDSSVVAAFVDIFHWKVDFRRDIRAGAQFAVVYQKLYHHGERAIAPGPILAAELDTGRRTFKAFRFADGARHAHYYYDSDGKSLAPSLLRTPVNYTRISSPFSLHRWNPVVHVWRPHYGVDLAAPRGTPIKAAGNGTITFMGRASGYGRLVKIHNAGPYSTRYAHMLRFARNLHVGSHVHQGQVIGYVGESGEATGPHLHFEIRIDGKPHDPLQVKLPTASRIPSRELARFEDAIAPLTAALEDPDAGLQPTVLASLDRAAADHSPRGRTGKASADADRSQNSASAVQTANHRP